MSEKLVLADAHGGVNLIGDHTDYHEGFVLPTLMPHCLRITMVRRGDLRVRATSTSTGTRQEYQLSDERAGHGWLDYVQGVTSSLCREGLQMGGFDVTIDSTIPMGAGVSSSAALTVALLRGLRQLFNLPLDDVRLARLARAAEVDFVGAPVGIMDQMACSLGQEGEALFIDSRSLAIERLPLPAAVELIVIDSGITHAHSTGSYRIRRAQSFAAAAALGVRCLRDVDMAALPQISGLVPILAARARHVVTENARVLRAVEALKAGELVGLGTLLNESHASMRDDYEVSTADIDTLVALGQQHPNVYGARLTGGGFGGAVVMLSRAGCSAVASQAICATYRAQTGQRGAVLVPRDDQSTVQ